jgi:hypothetical protein
MSVTFPLTSTAFFSTLKLGSVMFRQSFGQESSGVGSGEIIVKDLRPALWMAQCQTVPLTNDGLADVNALIELLGEGLNSFYAYDTRKQFPKADPTGSILGASVVTIDGTSGNFGLRLTGLPVGYVLTRGDLLSFSDGTSQLLHRVGETVSANGSGTTPLFEVRPKLSALTATAASDSPPPVVSLVKPEVEMKIVPGSYSPSDGPTKFTGIVSFQAVQRRR